MFGRSAGNHLVELLKNKPRSHVDLPENAGEQALARLARLNNSSAGEYSQDVGNDMRAVMQKHAGVFRTSELLKEGVDRIKEVAERCKHVHLRDKSQVFNTARVEALELDNLIEVAKATMISAEARKESRGAHAHRDFEKRDDVSWMKHTLWYSQDNRLDYKSVQLKPLTVDSIPPKERTF